MDTLLEAFRQTFMAAPISLSKLRLSEQNEKTAFICITPNRHTTTVT